jgi:hypothetical protein
MGELVTWLGANWVTVVGTAGTIVMAASVAVKAIAPFTDTKKDDKAAAVLDKIYGWLSKIALNPPADKE